jgi:iodotyrosine deiodinase
MTEATYVPLDSYRRYSPEEMKRHAASFHAHMQRRRSVRSFSSDPVPRRVIEDCVLTAGSAPSGANRQPWHFVVVSDPAVKRQIREKAEKEEYEFYHGRAGKQWLEALSGLGTGYEKPFLEEAPYLIVVFEEKWAVLEDGRKEKNYYVNESVGIATGFLIAAIHNAGMVGLPYTPSRMGFLRKILGRGENERPFLVLVVGYPGEGVKVPKLERKALKEIATFV